MPDNLPKVSKSLLTEEEESMWETLPPEILTLVLIRLPIKSIQTCTYVSTKWISLIRDPNFISSHLNHSNTHTHPILLFKFCSQSFLKANYSLRRRDTHEKEAFTLDWDNQEEHIRFSLLMIYYSNMLTNSFSGTLILEC